MFSEYIIKSLAGKFDIIFDNDEQILTLSCMRIDGPIFYMKTRIETTTVISSFDAKISALSNLIRGLATKLLNLNGDIVRSISFNSIDKKVAITIADFYIIFIETTMAGNPKALAKSISALIQE